MRHCETVLYVVSGMKPHKNVLLTNGHVDLANTIEIAQSMEAAQKDVWVLKLSSPDLTEGQVFRGSLVSRNL